MRASLRPALVTVAALAMVGLGYVFLDFVVLRGRTPGIANPGSIASLERVQLGGAEQWVLIRGHDRTKPVILFLHGGPGMPAMFLAHAFQPALERDFVMVHWDRRGAGKSFDAGIHAADLSVSQTLEDTYELTRMLRTRFGQPQIYLVGHSWGSYLGLLAVRSHPEYYRAFVGTGQLAGTLAQVRAFRHEFLSRIAREINDRKLLARLTSPAFHAGEDDLFRFRGELYASRSFWPIAMTGLFAPEYTLRDALHVKRGADFVGRMMTYDVLPRPLEGEISELHVPVFFFLGRHDMNTPSQLAAEYLDRLDAPLKGVVWFEHSSHFPFFEEPGRFHVEMLRVDHAVRGFETETTQPVKAPTDAQVAEPSVAADGIARRR